MTIEIFWQLIEKARNCGMWTKEAEKILKEFENE